MHDILQFHVIHGHSVVLSENGNVATRKRDDFGNGIVFSSKPIKIGQKICVEVTRVTEWSGALRIGVTTHDPAKIQAKDLPKFACPDLTNQHGYWARALNENYADTGNRITFYINKQGALHFFVNNAHKGILLNHLPTNGLLWIILDIYGNTSAVKLLPAEEAPVEILARGPDAMRAYHTACECGTQPVFRTRLMLVGQDRVGKTSLKNSLTGQRYNAEELSTDGIDLSASCSFNLRDRTKWTLAVKGGSPEKEQGSLTTISETQGFLENLEEEYHRAIANNIVQELLYRQKQQEKQEKTSARSDQRKSTASSNTRSAAFRRTQHSITSSSSTESHRSKTSSASIRSHTLLQEMPDEVVTIVESLLQERESSTMGGPPIDAKPDAQNGKNITLNIWDFAGQAAYYTTHQVFLSTRAIYVIVFNLCHEFSSPAKVTPRNIDRFPDKFGQEDSELSNLDYMDYWMNSIHAHAAQNTRNSADNTTLSPPIFVVGTHRNSLSEDPDIQAAMVKNKFEEIETLISSKGYERHIVPHYYAIENNMPDAEDEHLLKLRRHVEEVASKEAYMGEQIPIKWLKFEQAINNLVNQNTNFSSLDQIRTVAYECGIKTTDEFKTLLEFYHDLGVIIYYGGGATLDSTLQNTVILKPQWLVDMFKCLITARLSKFTDQKGHYKELWHKVDTVGILEEKLIDFVWQLYIPQKPVLLGLMKKFDLITERLPSKNLSVKQANKIGRSYFVPSGIRFPSIDAVKLYPASKQDVVFYLDFNGFLPEGLFHRILTRSILWSQEAGGHEPQLLYRIARFFLDSEHDFILEMSSLDLARIKVSVLRVVNLDVCDNDSSSDSSTETIIAPKPYACAKVRNFLESTLSDIREMWMKRLSYKACVECYCEQLCLNHNTPHCPDEDCRHFLNLDECLTNKIVYCEHRRIKTNIYRKWFPAPVPQVKIGPIFSDSNVDDAIRKEQDVPSWVKGAAKLLNGGPDGQDWLALARKLGYKKAKIEKFNEDINPALALITDWIISAGNTALSVDMMVTYLEQLQRDDIVEVIQKGQEAEAEAPQVFISYQWDSQDEVAVLRDRLEKAGFTCWMDIGQMGGGDQLYTKVDEGIRNCKVVLACMTPKYVVSHYCNREIGLADLLRKPIIPVVYEKIPWPPPGGMALVFSQLVYIDMKGIGGHGGSGIHADTQEKHREIIQRVTTFATPNPVPNTGTITARTDQTDITKATDVITVTTDSPDSYRDDDVFVIPGYSTDTSVVGNRGQQEVEQGPGRNSAAGPSAGRGAPVEQVAVTKCAVCTIL